MNNTTLAFVALTCLSLALIHETRLRRAAYNIACRLILALRHNGKAHDHARDGR
jgi:hypothetical protein